MSGKQRNSTPGPFRDSSRRRSSLARQSRVAGYLTRARLCTRRRFSALRRRNRANSFPSTHTECRDANRASLICLDNDCNYGGELTGEKGAGPSQPDPYLTPGWLVYEWGGTSMIVARSRNKIDLSPVICDVY